MCVPVPVLLGKPLFSPLCYLHFQRLFSVSASKGVRVVAQTPAHTPCVRFFQGAGVGRCAFGVNTPCPLDPLLGSNRLIHYI